MKRTLLLLAFFGLTPCVNAQGLPPLPAGDGVDLAFLGGKQPVLIRLRVLIDGKTVDAHFDELVEKWFRYFDVNNDGKLDAQELTRAPSSQTWTLLMRQAGFFPNKANTATLNQFGKNEGETVTLKELQDYYRKTGNPLQVVMQPSNPGVLNALSNALFKQLDLNNDGKLSKEELLAAAKTLRKLDLDDDEMITAQELSINPGNPGVFLNQPGIRGFPGGGTGQLGDSFFYIKAGENRLPALLLSLFDKGNSQKLNREEIGLDEATFARLDKNGDGQLDLEELALWNDRPADLSFTLRLGDKAGIVPHAARASFKGAVKESAAGVYQLSLDDAQISLVNPAGLNDMNAIRFNQAQIYVQLYRQADTKGQGFVEMSDLAGQQFQLLRQSFSILDRDRDGKLTLKEVQMFIDLIGASQNNQVVVSLADQGRALFQLLDANRDGRLSQRELQNAWARLAPLDKNKNGYIMANDLTRQFQLWVQRGLNNGNFAFNVPFGNPGVPAVAPNYPKDVPDWFRKMDRNGDGDVSFAEFLGSRELFDRIDTDHDGLISPEEAIRYDAMMRAKK